MGSKAASIFDMKGVARVGVFAALAFGINAPFLAIPNIEVFSLSLFLSGLFIGMIGGAATGLVAGIIFVFFNPNGAQPVLAVGVIQLLGFVMFGLCGGAIRPAVLKKDNLKINIVIMLLAGAVLTLCYDLSTNLTFALMFGPFWPTLIGGLVFSVVHIVSNAIIFGLSGTVIRKIWKRIEYIMPPLAAY